MENPTPQDKDDSRSVSEKSSSDKGQSQQGSNGSATLKSGQTPDATPTAVRSEQSTGMPSMLPPPKPNFKATPTSAQPSAHSLQESSQESSAPVTEKKRGSGRQRTFSSKDSNQEATKPVTRKRSHEEIDRRQEAEEIDDEDDDEHEEDATDEFNEPANAIPQFDWENLERRYHQQTQDCTEQEQDLYRQFSELCQYFYVWADSGSQHETQRSYKRMKTQITLVQHHEDELEEKRLHYIKVVEAFKTVARIINDAEEADPIRPAADEKRGVAGRVIPHAAIIDAYDWDDVHPSRCMII